MQQDIHNFTVRRKPVMLAVASTIPMMLAASGVYAGCSGSVASPYSTAVTEFCTGSDGNLINSGQITSNLSISNSNNALIQFEGLGKTLTNSGTLDNSSTLAAGATANRTRYGVFMGTATVGNTSLTGTSPGSASAPAVGATTLNIGAGKPATVVGQTVTFGRLDSAAGDFFAGDKKTIVAYDSGTGIATLDSALSATYFGDGTGTLPIAYNVISGAGVNKINNRSTGVISASIGAAEIVSNISGTASRSNTSSAKAISMDVAGDYVINNAGTIQASHAGVGGVVGIDGGGAVTSLTVNNTGTIAITRTSTLTLADNTATALTATTSTSGTLIKQSLGSAAAVYSQEELDAITINNHGIIEATGNFTPAVYLRAGEQVIENDGTIRSNTGNGFAIGSVSDSGEIRTLELANRGTIQGDILAVNGNAVRWYALSTLGTADNRLAINSNWGQLDSTIANEGSIQGNLYFSNGTHVLTNATEGSITGNIDVDQRDTTCTGCSNASPGEYTARTSGINASGNFTVVGSKSFTFENEGSFNGNLTIRTASSNIVGLDKTVTATSAITLVPTVTGSGAGSTQDAPSANIAGMGQTLKIWNGTTSTIDTTTTLAPRLQAVVHQGEWFKVADTLYGSALPQISSLNSALVTWDVAKNAGGNLVIGVDSIASLGSIGIAGNSASALNALMNYGGDNAGVNALGGAVLSMASADDVRRAGEQLRPEVNGATIQAALGVTDKVFGLVDNHLGETHLAQLTGKSGIATGDQPNGSGVWLQGFGFRGDQNRRHNVDGYNADAYGFALGTDTLLNTSTRVGAAFSYGQSNIDDKGVNQGNKTDIDSYQATLYGSMLMEGWYLNATLGLGKHQYDSKRLVLGNAVSGSHDAWQYTARVDAGWPFKLSSATVTPVASLTYSRLDQDGYTETGIGALTVGSQDTDSVRSGLGAKVLIPLNESPVRTALELRAIWHHEFANTAQETTASFAGGGGAFTTSGVKTARDAANLGASLILSHSDKDVVQNLLLSYDAEVKDQYLSHTGRLQARFDF